MIPHTCMLYMYVVFTTLHIAPAQCIYMYLSVYELLKQYVKKTSLAYNNGIYMEGTLIMAKGLKWSMHKAVIFQCTHAQCVMYHHAIDPSSSYNRVQSANDDVKFYKRNNMNYKPWCIRDWTTKQNQLG